MNSSFNIIFHLLQGTVAIPLFNTTSRFFNNCRHDLKSTENKGVNKTNKYRVNYESTMKIVLFFLRTINLTNLTGTFPENLIMFPEKRTVAL